MKFFWFFLSLGIIAGLTAVFFFTYETSGPIQNDNNKNRTEVTIAGQIFHLEVADTEAKRELGLSNRDTIGGEGMLFVFPNKGNYNFWMKDTRFPLDLVWVSDNTVIGFAYGKPESLEQLVPPKAVDYAIELQSGTVAKRGWRVGDNFRTIGFPK